MLMITVSNLVLSRGDRGPAVREAQRLVDGLNAVFGPRTEAAVRRMQATACITVDGVVGPVTWRTPQRRAVPDDSADG